MLHSTPLLLLLLLVEQHRGDLSPFLTLADGEPSAAANLPDLAGVPTQELPLVAAAASLAAGEPKRALRVLEQATEDRDVEDAATAIRAAALSFDLNRYPGDTGAVMAPEEMTRAAVTPPDSGDAGVQLLALVGARLLPSVQSARAIADSVRAVGGDALDTVYGEFQQIGTQLEPFGVPTVLCYVWVAAADVARRAGRWDDAAGLLRAGHDAAGDDMIAHAHLRLVQGDWALEPLSHPETMGLSLTGGLPSGPETASDLATAAAHYDQADELYRQAVAPRGGAAVALRRAHVARRAGDPARAASLCEEASDLAGRAGERALHQVAGVHRLLDRLHAGEDAGFDDALATAEWSRADGSTSLGRGLVRLVLACSVAWQATGATLEALRAMRLARRLVGVLDAPLEADLADRAYVDLVDRVNFRRASVALLAADAAQAVTRLRTEPSDPLVWAQAADVTMSLDRTAEALADPDVKAVAAARLAEVAAAAPDGGSVGFAREAVEAVAQTARRAETLVLRYRGRRAEQAGFREEAMDLLGQALALAEQQGDEMVRAVLLAELGRGDEARSTVDGMVAAGSLHLDHATELYLRIGDPQAAHRTLEQLDASGWTASRERPWEDGARRAELSEALGDHARAAALAARAIDDFEERSAQLVRDVLRVSATDDVTVAGMYHTAVLAHLGLSGGEERGDDVEHVARAFELSERCRGLVVDVVAALDRLPEGPGREAARRWVRAGSAWAATYEGLVEEVVRDPQDTPTSDELRQRVLAAEEELDTAEADVARLAPALLATRGEVTPGVGLSDIQQHLDHGVGLVLYETFDDDLLIWAVDRRSVLHRRLAVRARDLACDVRRFHTACAAGTSDPATAARLTELLLQPIADALDGIDRLLVVPHRALTLVPFHALPWDDGLLADRVVVSFLPSAALVTRASVHGPPRIDQPALLVGDPAYAAARGLPALPGTATEVAGIARILGIADPLVGSDATEAAVTGAAAGRPVIHLATHGFVDERAPNRSFVALAGNDELTVGDVMGLDLAADLVVLSACHTGRGTATAGGDVAGLVRSAVAAGARHVVVSLWPVDDEAGCLLMTRMYERLQAGDDVAAALATAQRDVRALDRAARREAYDELRQREETAPAAVHARDARPVGLAADADHGASPYFWAPFIHVGA